jgi:hypothetical protein
MKTLHLRKSMSRSPLRGSFLVIAVVLACFTLSPTARAQLPSPTPDGGYPGGNTAEGTNALFSRTTGIWNTALGAQALFNDIDGGQNTGTGFQALFKNIDGSGNTAYGAQALYNNTNGYSNEASGFRALYSNTTGRYNTGIGYQALVYNTTGESNTGTGKHALWQNTTGGSNTATGSDALAHNTTGFGNTAVGDIALPANTTGNSNTALGVEAGYNVRSASNVICIGHLGADVSNTTWIGNVYGVTTQNGTTAPVIVSADGQLGTVASSERFKKDIASMDKTSEAVLLLRPVTFHYKTDTKAAPQFGLIAEEVAKLSPELVLPDKEGKPYSVRYDAVNAMLLNEFLKAHRKGEEQETTITQLKSAVAQQQKGMEVLTAILREQASQIQKVSAQLELRKTAPQTVASNQ